jgi:hypothetical protein
MAKVVPEGIVTFFGGGSGGGTEGAGAETTGGGVMAATGAEFDSSGEDGTLRVRGSWRLGLGAGDGLVSST